jgi:hypothetical protein
MFELVWNQILTLFSSANNKADLGTECRPKQRESPVGAPRPEECLDSSSRNLFYAVQKFE